MKNHVFTFAFLLLTLISVGAPCQVMSQQPKYSYCELVGTHLFLSNKVVVGIDFGQATKFFQSNVYKDETTGKPKVFNSMVDALNFMGDKGWEFVQAYVVTTSNQNVYHWLLKTIDTE